MSTQLQGSAFAYGEWQENTLLNPFWDRRGPVEIEFADGHTFVAACPSCGRRQMDKVKRWRTITKSQPAAPVQ